MDINELYSTPIWKMTGEELAKLISSVIEGKLGRIGQDGMTTPGDDNHQYAYGIQGICDIFGCSRPTALRIKRSGAINEAISQIDRTIVIDRQKALDLVKNRKHGRRNYKFSQQ
jgi:hypothetical protein